MSEIVITGDVGGRGDLVVTVKNGTRATDVLNTSWEDVGSAGVGRIIELATELGAALNVPVRDETT